MLLISAFLQVIYILNSCFQILYMCFLKQFTYLFSILAYCACVFPVIIHAGSLFFALKHVFSNLLYIPNYDFWIIRMCFLLFCTYLILVFELSACISWFFAHTKSLFLNCPHVFLDFLHILNPCFLLLHMYSQMLCLNNWDAFHNPAEKDCSPGRRCGGDCEIFLESGWAAGATRTRCSR